jgi:hypothetical protein
MEGPVRFEHDPEQAENGDVETVCKMLDIKVPRHSSAGEGDPKGGWLTLSGNLTRVCVFNTHLTVQTLDGSFDFIEGSTDDTSDRISQENWTYTGFDENTKSGDPVGSFLYDFSRDTLLSGQFDTAPRKVVKIEGWEEELYSLPIIKWKQEGVHWSKGLILCKTIVENQPVFQRMGSFTTSGSVLTSKLMENLPEEVMII